MLTDENEFQYFHAYQRYARALGRQPFTCQSCGYALAIVSRAGKLNLWCPTEDTFMRPGIQLMHDVETAVGKVEL